MMFASDGRAICRTRAAGPVRCLAEILAFKPLMAWLNNDDPKVADA